MKQIYSENYALILANSDAFQLNHPSTIYTDDTVSVFTGTTEDEVDKKMSEGITTVSLPPLPETGEWVVKDKLYSYNGQIVKCIQEHSRTIYSPELTPALFSVYRINSDTLTWITNEKVFVGWIRIYNSKSYKCIQAHQTQETWNPELTVGTLWQVVVTSAEWTVGVAYKVDEKVTYQGKIYKCLQAHTSISTWNPVAAASLWKVQ